MVAPEGLSFHQGQIAEAVHFQEQYFISTIDSIFQKSCGVVPFRRAGGWNRNFCFCSSGVPEHHSPKGHMEAGETEERTALRELFEETGFRTRLIPSARAATEYRISSVARKQVVFFLGEVHGEPKLQAKEISILPLGETRASWDSTCCLRSPETCRKSAACADIECSSAVSSVKNDR